MLTNSADTPVDRGKKTYSQIAAAIVVFFPLGLALLGSRGLSRIPVGPIFLYDVALLAAAAGFLTLILLQPTARLSLRSTKMFFLFLIPLWATATFLFSVQSRDALREYHPFLSLTYAVFVSTALPHLSARLFRRGIDIALIALVGFWGVFNLRSMNFFYGWWEPSSKLGVDISGITGDADGWLLGLLAGLLFVRFSRQKIMARFLASAAVVGIHFQIALIGNRAAQLSALVILILAIVASARGEGSVGEKSHSREVILTGVAVLLLAVTLSLLGTGIGERYAGAVVALTGSQPGGSQVNQLSVEPSGDGDGYLALEPASTETENLDENHNARDSEPSALDSGEGTARARLTSWGVLLAWISEEPRRLFFGVGMGSDYFWESGARESLMSAGEREEGENRWPHNFLLTVLAVGGIFPLIIFVGLILATFWRFLSRSDSPNYPQATLGLMVLAGVCVVSFFGVVFENPYGSIPFAWAVGVGASLSLRSSSFGRKLELS